MTYLISEILNEKKEYMENDLLFYKNKKITHAELDDYSNKYANYLQSEGIKKYDRVLLLLDLNIETIIIIFALLKLGAIYVPIDPNQSEENISNIINDTKPILSICDEKYTNKLENIKMKIIFYDESREHLIDLKAVSNQYIKPRLIPTDLAYIIFTSGTTGKPKGVMINHMSVMTFVNYVVKEHNHSERIRSLCRTPIYFDPFLTEVLPSCLSGGKVYIQDRTVTFRSFLKFLEKNQISNFGCGPSMLYLMASNIGILRNFKLECLEDIYIGYEKCPLNLVKILRKELPNVKFINGYGTSETFASTTFYLIDNTSLNNDDLPIGKPIAGADILLYAGDGREAGIDEIGEILIRGTTLFNGYWHNEIETAKKLKKNPINSEFQEKVYFTGDLAKKDKNNNIFFVGRKDNQVKINGYRVELGEIEYLIYKKDFIKECMVFYNKKIICLYNTYSRKTLDERQIHTITKNMCSYKIPKQWIYIDNFIRNKNGKIDRKKMEECYIDKC